MTQILGHHHISMRTKSGDDNTRFYRDILGLKRVKVSVNQNDPYQYHLFYGDNTGSPGFDLTFFENQRLGNTKRGTNAITTVGLLLENEDSFPYWQKRLTDYKIKYEVGMYANYSAILFQDNDTVQLALIASNGTHAPFFEPWPDSPIPLDQQIKGMGPVEFVVRDLAESKKTLVDLFNYHEVYNNGKEALYQAVEGDQTGEILVTEKEGPKERPGRGSTHHLAIRVADHEALNEWHEKITQHGYEVVARHDRYYFESLYFRDHNDIMFELATDGPGFTVDQKPEELGTILDLPPFLEPQRDEIMGKLNPLKGIKED
ncbi:ring-cleaving dioxygenase [Jeotgalibaca sp. A127]|uniref:ring-cleaving dioxygenase n=1 Tax=Jeotgalibaca sp. A127 TaxID=3457324 RepID=UPI003FD58036